MSHSRAVFMKMLYVETTTGTELVPSNIVPATPTAGDVAPYLVGEPLSYKTGDLKVQRREGWYLYVAPIAIPDAENEEPTDVE